jgi:hypothetical protein
VTLIELTPRSTGLSRYAAHRLHARPGEVDALARALVAADDPAGDVAGVSRDAIADARRSLRGRRPSPSSSAARRSPSRRRGRRRGHRTAPWLPVRASCRRCAAATCTARSTWASLRVCCPVVSRWAMQH